MEKKTILFVDDEYYLAEVGKEMLEDYGYEVDIETDPVRALSLFETTPERYDLMITDYTMPGMTGDLVAEKVHQIRPELPVILCSGTQLSPEVTQRVSIAEVLLKPFDLDDLITMVKAVLGTK